MILSLRVAVLLLMIAVALRPKQTAAQADTLTLIAYEHAATYPRTYLDSLWKANKVPQFISPVRYGVEVFEVLYWTSWHDGSRIQASGLYFLPLEQRVRLPLVSYNHGSRSEKDRGTELHGEAVITAALATDGYAALMPDYVGLGKGEGMHLYHHAETEALATLDMLRAVRSINRELGVSTNGQLFLSGYSQGGHAAMAAHKMIEERFAGEFSLTASAPLSGAYDLEGVQAEVMYREYARPGYFPFLLWGMNEAYGIMPDLREALKPEYADTLVRMVESQHYSLRQIGRAMPSVPVYIVRPGFLQAYQSDTAFLFRRAMRENSLLGWAPQRPMMLCYCESDELVDYRNSLVAHASMREQGSRSVQLRQAGRKFSHNDCALYASLYAKMYFDSFVKGSEKGRKGPMGKRFLVSLGKMGHKSD